MADDVEVRYAKEHIPSNLMIKDPRKDKPRWGGISLSALLQKAEEFTSGVITIPKVHREPIRCMCFSETTGVCVLGSYDNILSVWEPSDWSCLGRLYGHGSDRDREVEGGKGGWVVSVVALEDGRIASGSKDHRIKIWCLETFQCLMTLTGHVDQVTALTIDGMGRIASGSTDFTIKVWDVDTGKCVRTMRDHYGIILAMTTLKSGKIISSAADRSVKVWNTTTGDCEVSLEAAGSVWCLCPLLDGGFTCGYYSKGRISIWKPSNKDPDIPFICTRILKGHKHGVTYITQLPDGKLVSSSYDRTVKMWDIFAPKTTTRTIVIHNNAAFCAKLIHGTTKLVSIGCDRSIHITPLPLDEDGGYQGPSGGVFGSLGGLGGLGGGRPSKYQPSNERRAKKSKQQMLLGLDRTPSKLPEIISNATANAAAARRQH